MGATDRPLAGRTALVTGGARRIGRAITLALARAGANVVVHYRHSRDEAGEVAALARDAKVDAWEASCDLSDTAQVAPFMDRVLALTGGRLDLLVNNASIYPETRLATMTPDELEACVRLHVTAPLLLAQRFAALGRAGDIVNLLDARITAYDAEHAAYHLSKRMLFSLTRMLALDLAPRIRVNAVAPGAVLPPEGADDVFLERVSKCNPLQSHGTPAGVAECVLMLVRNGFITGQVIYYDGGYHMKAATYG
ncbi:MAG: SDR family oxidoreductase [Kiritimatiellae bacterium]|nr:SDR family oxidoreductase [Kiritimatiellia bacterium]